MLLNILGFLLIYIALSIGGFFFSFYKKRFEETLILSMGFIIVFLYITYILNILNFGYIILLLLMGCILIYSIYKFIKSKDKKEVLSYFFTPGFVIYTICFVAIFLIVRYNRVLLWDELRLWGAYPKILYYDGSLQLGKDAMLYTIMQSYEPGMPLFQFFFTKTALDFKESYLFLSYAILCLGTLLPMTKKLTFKKWYYIPAFVLLLIMLPVALANSGFDFLTYYKTLFIEPGLGLFFGFTLYLSTRNNDNIIDYLIFLFSLLTLVLLKDTGIVFAAGPCISYIVISIIRNRRADKKKKKKNYKKIFAPLIICLALFASWKLVQKVYSTENLYASKTKSDEIVSFFNGMTNEQKQVIKDFHEAALNKSFDSNFDFLEKYINFYTMFLFVIACLIIIIYLNKKEDRYIYKTSTIAYFAVCFVYILGTLVLYIFSLHTVASFQRYSSVVFISGLLLITIHIIDGIFNKEDKFYAMAVYLVLFFILVTPIRNLNDNVYLRDKVIDNDYYSDVIAENVDPKKEDVILVFGSSTVKNLDSVLYQHHIYMNLLDEGFGDVELLVLSDKNTDGSDQIMTFKEEDKLFEYISNYDYAYIFIVNEPDKDEFSRILNIDIDSTTFYKVESDGLKPVD